MIRYWIQHLLFLGGYFQTNYPYLCWFLKSPEDMLFFEFLLKQNTNSPES